MADPLTYRVPRSEEGFSLQVIVQLLLHARVVTISFLFHFSLFSLLATHPHFTSSAVKLINFTRSVSSFFQVIAARSLACQPDRPPWQVFAHDARARNTENYSNDTELYLRSIEPTSDSCCRTGVGSMDVGRPIQSTVIILLAPHEITKFIHTIKPRKFGRATKPLNV